MISETDFTELKNRKINYNSFFNEIIKILKVYFNDNESPSVSKIKEEGANPFEILISTIISARTKDEVTYKSSKRLFSVANSPEKMAKLSEKEIAEIIYPCGFYNIKAKNIKKTCEILINKFDSKVPDDFEQLLNLPGVGRKTANLVIAVGFQKDGLCVDTHVHRISNRLGIIKTKSPYESEFALRKILPIEYWEVYNKLLVLLGQKICKAQKPICNYCPLDKCCKKVNVKNH